VNSVVRTSAASTAPRSGGPRPVPIPEASLTMNILPARLSRALPRRARAGSSRAGFSLAELMVVVVILGLIATIVVPNLLQRFGVAQRKKAEIDIAQLESAVTQFTLENNGRQPESLELLVTPDENNRTFLKGFTSVPRDPWGHPYEYEPPSAGKEFRIYSLGADGAPGGEGDDADIDNLTIKNQDRR
jgi:general secretion pathway protein G